MTPTTDETALQRRAAYWRSTRRLTGRLLLVWAGVTLITIFFARELSGMTLFGWPISFYMAAQGSTLCYLAIVGIYAWRMRRLDQVFDKERPDGQ